MKPRNIFDQLGDINSDAVKDALTRKCRMCDAEPDQLCDGFINGVPLDGRLVHFARFEAIA